MRRRDSATVGEIADQNVRRSLLYFRKILPPDISWVDCGAERMRAGSYPRSGPCERSQMSGIRGSVQPSLSRPSAG